MNSQVRRKKNESSVFFLQRNLPFFVVTQDTVVKNNETKTLLRLSNFLTQVIFIMNDHYNIFMKK